MDAHQRKDGRLTVRQQTEDIPGHRYDPHGRQEKQSAMENGQLSAAVAAIKEKGVLSRKRIERSEIGGRGEFDHLSDEELRALVIKDHVHARSPVTQLMTV